MRQMQNSEGRSLCFPQRITETLGKIIDYPLTIVEAPMGYGKTTAVREHLSLTSANLLWQNVYDDSKIAFWRDFCLLFKELDNNCTHSLSQLGFPSDSISMHTALTLIKNMDIYEQTIVVIDDYHHVDTQDTANFITLLAGNEIKNFHIVLISRFFEFFSIEELSLKGYLYHVQKEIFEFSREEIREYYQCCDISLTTGEADELYKLTEGWISALYLLMINFKEGGSFLTSINIYKLIEQVVYNPFPDRIKEFLLSMSIYNTFTPEQASYIMPDADIENITSEVTGMNAFVTYDSIQGSYHIHSIFKNFLSSKLKLTRESFQTDLFRKAAAWYMQTGDYFLSIRYSHLCGDYDAMFESFELDKGQSLDLEHKDLLTKYYNDCPEEYKTNHPYAVLIYASRMFMFNEMSLFKRSCEAFMTIYRNLDTEDATYKDNLLGEYQLLMSFAKYNDIEKMAEYHKEAYKLLKKLSRVFDKQSSFTHGSPSILYLFYRKSGELSKTEQTVRESMPYYCQITGDHGKGAEDIMSAERFYHVGDFQKAEIAMHSAYHAAAEASDIMICTILLDSKIKFMKGDLAGVFALLQKQRNIIYENQQSKYAYIIDICEAYVYCGLHMIEKVEPWIKNGEFHGSWPFFRSLAYLNIVYGKVLLRSGEYTKLLGNVEQFLSLASVYPNLLAQIYTYIYSAAANAALSRADDAVAALKQALDIAMPDQLYMPFAENGDMIKYLLEELQANSIYTDDIIEILALHERYQKAAKHMIKEISVQGKAALTERENEIAHLAAQGLTNKEIGEHLYISENTVKTQLKSVFVKLGVNSRSLLKQSLER